MPGTSAGMATIRRGRGPTAIVALAAATLLALVGCGGPEDYEPGLVDDGIDTDSEVGSYSVMAEWDGCTALQDIQPVVDYMGIVGWGSLGLVTAGIPGGLDGEAFNCGGHAELPSYHLSNSVVERKELPGSGWIDVGVIPWDSDEEATESFAERVTMLQDSLATGGTEYTNVLEGAFPEPGDWDETYYYAGNTSTGYGFHAIARQGDLVLYVFIDYIQDFGTQMDDEPAYPFTDAELVAWVLGDYMPATHGDLLEQKDAALT